ncbi:hypothetical protein C8R47DRAFT_1230597 [Mycena vitilis]|nr:hypothetical protein C8R47DRAFT_1230597 [Mycena vitilis]
MDPSNPQKNAIRVKWNEIMLTRNGASTSGSRTLMREVKEDDAQEYTPPKHYRLPPIFPQLCEISPQHSPHLQSWNTCRSKVRDPAAKPLLQAAEQRWQDFIGPWRAAHGMPARPAWALEPLRELDRVRVTPALPAARGSASARTRAPVRTPASSSSSTPARTPAPIRTPASSSSSAPTRTPAHFYGVIDISDDEEGVPSPRARHALRAQLPTPPPSSPARADLSQNVHTGRKRKFVDLGVVEVSDGEEEEVRPRKKARFLGYIDLTV